MVIIEEEETIAVPVRVLKEILVKLTVMEDAVKKTEKDIFNLSSEFSKYAGLQGARDKEYTAKLNKLIQAVAGVSGTFSPIETFEELQNYETKLKKSTIEVEILVIKISFSP